MENPDSINKVCPVGSFFSRFLINCFLSTIAFPNLKFQTDLPLINYYLPKRNKCLQFELVCQDIRREMLNILNNAFQTLSKKALIGFVNFAFSSSSFVNPENPTIAAKTTEVKSPSDDIGVQISESDNGTGIPPEIKDKIFQPFFTTKPTGEGTGLGLSLSYDIVKAHGGSIKVNSQENVGTVFIIEISMGN